MSKKINIDKILENKPGNESKEHYISKIAGFFYLYQSGCRIIDTELSGFMSEDDYERYKDRQVLELSGSKVDKLNKGICPFCGNKLKSYGNNRYKCLASKIPKKKKYGKPNPYYEKYKKIAVNNNESLTMNDENCEKEYWKKDGSWYKYRESNSMNQIIDCAGIKRPNYKNIEDTIIRGIEAKASYNDFKSGFCTGADITYIITPQGIIPKKEIPKYIGLIEVDFDKLEIIIKNFRGHLLQIQE